MAMSMIGTIIAGVILFGAMGAAYFIFLKSRPKKITWDAKIFERSGSMENYVTKDGKKMDAIPTESIRLIGTDIIEKVDMGKGLSPYRLQKYNAPIPEILAKHTQILPNGRKEVWVLKDGESFSLMTPGVDQESRMVFRAADYDLSNMMLNQYHIKMSRLAHKKDTAKALMSLIGIIIVCAALVACAYSIGGAWTESLQSQEKIAKINLESTENIQQGLLNIGKSVQGLGCMQSEVKTDLGRQAVPTGVQ